MTELEEQQIIEAPINVDLERTKIKRKLLGFFLSEFSGILDDLVAQIRSIETKFLHEGYSDLYISSDGDYGSGWLTLYGYSMETNQEVIDRVKRRRRMSISRRRWEKTIEEKEVNALKEMIAKHPEESAVILEEILDGEQNR